jgi:hypothetical protein
MASVLSKDPGPYPRNVYDIEHPAWQLWFNLLSAYMKENGKLTGATGTFTTADAKTVTVVNGIITTIV